MRIRLTLATRITLIRFFLVPLVVMGILYHRYGTTLLIFLISGLTDLFDGLIARKLHQKSKLGALLDPLADKLLLSTSFLLLTLPSSRLSIPIPIWVAIAVFGRDLFLVVSSIIIYATTRFMKFDPTIYGKASTVVQIACVLLVLVANYFQLPPESTEWIFYLTFAITVFSGLHYIYVFRTRYHEHSEKAS